MPARGPEIDDRRKNPQWHRNQAGGNTVWGAALQEGTWPRAMA
jgi:hypothetical protein